MKKMLITNSAGESFTITKELYDTRANLESIIREQWPDEIIGSGNEVEVDGDQIRIFPYVGHPIVAVFTIQVIDDSKRTFEVTYDPSEIFETGLKTMNLKTSYGADLVFDPYEEILSQIIGLNEFKGISVKETT